MTSKIIAGNWKMNGDKAMTLSMINALQAHLQSPANHPDVVLFPPAPYLPLLQQNVEDSLLTYGAQTMSEFSNGAYTGELSATMLTDVGCKYVLVGHSERRSLFGETDTKIAEKFHAAQQHDIVPMLCIGETEAERGAEKTMDIVKQQLTVVLDKNGIEAFNNTVVAYEPVWAIGTGKTATPQQAQEVHQQIRAFLAEYDADIAAKLSILYGGSVKADNAKDLFAMADIDGALVGGASLDAEQFIAIIKAYQSL